MRSNLLSLQNISGQVSSTQNKLATGNKVNSAIDNPSSYYTALSLNNRAEDLNALLDSMGQAVSTIKAATTALESAAGFLEQASAVATQALETAKVPSKSFFEEKVGENGAVVTTAEELREAVNSGKETICVYGHIDLGDISTTGGLNLKSNQKLVGVGYFGDYDSDTNKFSAISATANTAKDLITLGGTNSLVSDLSISCNTANDIGITAIQITGYDTVAHLHNLDIAVAGTENGGWKTAIHLGGSGSPRTTISGDINIDVSGNQAKGIALQGRSGCDIEDKTKINVSSTGSSSEGIVITELTTMDIGRDVEINIQSSGSLCSGFVWKSTSDMNLKSGTIINIKSEYVGMSISNAQCNIDAAKINIEAQSGSAINLNNTILNINKGAQLTLKSLGGKSTIDILSNAVCNIGADANLNIYSENLYGIYGIYLANNSNNQLNILSSAQVYLDVASGILFYNGGGDGTNSNTIDIAQGAKIAIEKDGKADWYEVKDKYHDENTVTTNKEITADNIKDELNVENTSAWTLPETAEVDFDTDISEDEAAQQTLTDAGKNYKEIINQYDALIKGDSYKGINLLQNDKLSVKFNETNTADLSVQGKDMSSQALGFTVFGWETQGDIADSLAEIANALKGIRSYSAELGNNYSIITTRQNFTENLINVLTEGADKLTLADMNEESANMLALQTRQQLAINSLSLASQASQSILKLF